MLPLERSGFTKKEILNVLHGKHGVRSLQFRYDLLDSEENFIRTLDSVQSGEVSMAALASIKRTARFRMKDNGVINWLSDRIQPFVEVKMPNSDYIEFPMGIFLLNSPIRTEQNNYVYRDVEAYGLTQILRADKFINRYTVSAGTNYRTAIIDILNSAGIIKHNIEETDKVIPIDIDWAPGIEKLEAINELIGAINYTPIYDDVYGYFTSFSYRSPSARSAEYVYSDDELSVMYSGMSEELDTFGIYNSWVVTFSNPEREPLVSTYTNDNPESPTSTINRGRLIVDVREIDNIADQQALDAHVQRIAFESSQVYGKIEFETAIMPMHDYNDVIELNYQPLGIQGKYSETGWTIPLEVGGKMKHSLRRVVEV